MKNAILNFEVILALLSWSYLRYIQNRVIEEIVDWDLDRRLSKTIKYLWMCNPVEIVLRLAQVFARNPSVPTFSLLELGLCLSVYLLLVAVILKTVSIRKIVDQVKSGHWEEVPSGIVDDAPWYAK